ncbi:MAG: phospholipid/cholesterol/gamma-HCH transport system ATP-binding protein [Flavobacteriales bacterium]|jgi:phospholipid/cholesterol/gamma-HCH transport system ATP-binding protein
MIEVKDIYKSFGDSEIIKGVSCVFERGKTNLIIGQSGSGKTVFLKCMVGLYEVNSGQIIFNGKDWGGMDFKARKELRKEIGMVFQAGALFDSMTVEENIMFPLNMFSDMSLEEKIARANFCLNRVNLENKNDLYPAEISGGMQKRVAIARAIVMNPKYLFCDEPNSGLDPKTAMVIDNLVKEITEEYNITTIINTHDMNSVLEIGEKVIFLSHGKKAWEGDKQSILTTDHEDVVDFVYTSQFLKQMRNKNK